MNSLSLGGSWVRLWMVVLLFLASTPDERFASAANSRFPTRHPIKINPGPPSALPTPNTPSSHTFTIPEPDPTPTPPTRRYRLPAINPDPNADPSPTPPILPTPATPLTPHNQADAIRATKMPGAKPAPTPTSRPPAAFTLPPPLLLAERQSLAAGGADSGEVDVRYDLYEEALWRRWDGDCMVARLEDYRYELCPFHNVTQRGLRLTRLNVVLGMWSSWWTTPSHQLAMNFTDGTSCNEQLNRSTTLILHCSAPRSITQSTAPTPPIDVLAEYSPSYIAAVDEPSPCTYRMHWYTPLVCSAYRKVADELRKEQQNSQPQPSAQPANKQQLGSAERMVQLELELGGEEGVEGGVERQGKAGEVSFAGRDSAEVRGYLDCIAAMSAPNASADLYRAACATHLPSNPSAHSGEHNDEIS